MGVPLNILRATARRKQKTILLVPTVGTGMLGGSNCSKGEFTRPEKKLPDGKGSI